MISVNQNIHTAIASEKNLLAVLVDPAKFLPSNLEVFLEQLPPMVSHLLVGGSTVEPGQTISCVQALKRASELPVILFPGHWSQLTASADALLFLSLLSGRNPEYLIEQQIQAARYLRKENIEIIPTGYILINGGRESAVQRVSGTDPLPVDALDEIVHTALAGEYSGKRLIYLEAGSGASKPVPPKVIKAVRKVLTIPLIVGGGIRSKNQLQTAYCAGANMVVVGTAFEDGHFFLN